jgi:hypothetical protein
LKTLDNQYKHCGDDGSYTVCFGDRTIEIKFVDFLGEMLIEKFCKDLELMLRVADWQYWGGYCGMVECDDSRCISQFK